MKLLEFTSFMQREKERKLVFESIVKKVQKRTEIFRKEFEKRYYSNKPLIVEDVDSLFDLDVHQTEQDVTTMNRFIDEYKAMTPEEKMSLVELLSKPLPGDKHIDNNNETKLILIYKTDPDSMAGIKAHETIILEKQKWFEYVATKAAATGKIPANQAADYAQQMTLTLLGGGDYNQKNNKKFSLDGYNPFSGVPFNSFIKTYIINSALNKFSAKYNSSIATDYAGSKMNVVSADAPIGNDQDEQKLSVIDTITDTSQAGRDPSQYMSQNEEKLLLRKYLSNAKLKQKQKKALQMRYGLNNGEQATYLEIGLALGYPRSAAIQNGRRILQLAQSKLKQFARQNFRKK